MLVPPLLIAGLASCTVLLAQSPPSDGWRSAIAAETAKVLDGLDAADVGLVVGVYRNGKFEFETAGKRKVDAETLYEIGSITKVFTAVALADASLERDVEKPLSLDDPITRWLPADAVVPTRGERAITLRDLSRHSSGLPRLPPGFRPADPTDPYADFDAKRLVDALATTKLRRDVGSGYEYSNYGTGLLGHLLAGRDGLDYEAMLRARVLAPLKLTDTWIALPEAAAKRLAPGHDASGKPAANWHFDALAGAGALRASAHDVLKFAAANLAAASPDAEGAVPSRITQALRLCQRTERVGNGPQELGLGWHVGGPADARFLWHNGGTAGYRSFLGIDFAAGTAVVALVNCSRSVDAVGAAGLRSIR
jgi:D-alanyl-D-alanine-carboxypeptidase/D-alanyl-D-alanine-endopeptidase